MQLLVSVRSASEVNAALAGGADIIDAKDPAQGALGAVTAPVFLDIYTASRNRVPVSAALGDFVDVPEVQAAIAAYAIAGAAFVKIGFSGTTDSTRVRRIIAAARDAITAQHSPAARACAIVAVGYADSERVGAIEPRALVEAAASSGARGVLLDTASKRGARLRDLVTPPALKTWVADVHAAGLFAALAGRLTDDDVWLVAEAGADIIGVRGSACTGGRLGVVSADRVARLHDRIGDAKSKRAEAVARALSGAS